MIKKLQRKFILIAMIASVLVTCSIFGIILADNFRTIDRQTDGILNLISDNNGEMPEYKQRNDYLSNVITKETRYSTRYFIMRLNDSGEITETNMKYIASINQEDAKEILKNILKEGKTTGYYNNFKYKITQKEGEKLIVFLDCSSQLNNFKTTTEKSIMIIIIGLTIVFIILSVLSKRVLKPIIENIDKQKQFITNAGHELKTPVAVIMANLDVMEMTSSENQEWITSIRNQTKRLEVLIKSLLNLANVDERDSKLNYTEFSVTEIIKTVVSEFKPLIQDRELIYDDSNEVLIKADYNSIVQLVTIFIDNAIKYTPQNGKIKIVTEKVGKNVKMQFSNNCENPENINTKKIFDRFYRNDESRSQKKEGYGIGLSIARSIVKLHKGKVSAEIDKEKMICFTVII